VLVSVKAKPSVAANAASLGCEIGSRDGRMPAARPSKRMNLQRFRKSPGSQKTKP